MATDEQGREPGCNDGGPPTGEPPDADSPPSLRRLGHTLTTQLRRKPVTCVNPNHADRLHQPDRALLDDGWCPCVVPAYGRRHRTLVHRIFHHRWSLVLNERRVSRCSTMRPTLRTRSWLPGRTIFDLPNFHAPSTDELNAGGFALSLLEPEPLDRCGQLRRNASRTGRQRLCHCSLGPKKMDTRTFGLGRCFRALKHRWRLAAARKSLLRILRRR